MERIPASERTREKLKALMEGRSEASDGRSELVRLAARLIIERSAFKARAIGTSRFSFKPQLTFADLDLDRRIERLFKEEGYGYGFIRSSHSDEIYMHRNAVADGRFGNLSEGDEVRYFIHEAEGENRPQASTVVLIGKHHLAP